ncbi:DUF3088 family protein [uncultured Roseobacter sp.]|uniref:DUF3088 family protein n=1 Tax=uncultured Roseobacter sp. TaxID=114847 RepID=UPI00344BBCB7
MMPTTILYLLRSEFADVQAGNTSFYCPQCLLVEGLLAVFPHVRQNLDIRYVDFDRPRGDMSLYVGDNQSCPQLVFPDEDHNYSTVQSLSGNSPARRIDNVSDILTYLIQRFDLPRPHP